MKNFFAIILIGVIFFLGGMTTGSFVKGGKIKILKLSNTSGTKDYFSEIVKAYNPAAASVVFNYQGTLKKLSDSEIVLVDDKGQKFIVPVNEEVKKVMVYQDFITHRPAKKSDFTIGSRVYVQLVTNWISGEITNFTLGLKPGS